MNDKHTKVLQEYLPFLLKAYEGMYALVLDDDVVIYGTEEQAKLAGHKLARDPSSFGVAKIESPTHQPQDCKSRIYFPAPSSAATVTGVSPSSGSIA
jgi:hypothetical protein